MKNLFFAPRGTQDILPNETKLWQQVKDVAIKVSELFGFYEIILPTFESKELFTNSVGEATDIVSKEMFCFVDQSNKELALRPEGTASTVRAIIEHGLLKETLPLKLFYLVNCFRNERPQAGRYKEFYQFGIELFGSKNPEAEFEVISLADLFFKKLNILNLTLEINSIGCASCRKNFKKELISYFEKNLENICEICKERLFKNPLRILDCKVSQCQEITKNAPKILDFLCDECKNHFKDVCKFLDVAKIKYSINHNLVRGLDYYSRTVFEFKANDSLGAQNTLCGGGRYDGLIETLGAPSTPALGFGMGLNRLVLILKQQQELPKTSYNLYIGTMEKNSISKAIELAKILREKNFSVCVNLLEKTVKAQMKYANKINSKFSIIIGENELKTNQISLKNMQQSSSKTVSLSNFVKEFEEIFKEQTN